MQFFISHCFALSGGFLRARSIWNQLGLPHPFNYTDLDHKNWMRINITAPHDTLFRSDMLDVTEGNKCLCCPVLGDCSRNIKIFWVSKTISWPQLQLYRQHLSQFSAISRFLKFSKSKPRLQFKSLIKILRFMRE